MSRTVRRPMRATRTRASDFRRRRSPLDGLDRGATTGGPWLNAGLERLRGERQQRARTPLWAAGDERGPKDRPARPSIEPTERSSRPDLPSRDGAAIHVDLPTLSLPPGKGRMYLRLGNTGVALSADPTGAIVSVQRGSGVLQATPLGQRLSLWFGDPATPEAPPDVIRSPNETICFLDGCVIELAGRRVRIEDAAIRAAMAVVDRGQPPPDLLFTHVVHLVAEYGGTRREQRAVVTHPLMTAYLSRHAALATTCLHLPTYVDGNNPYGWPPEDDRVHRVLLAAAESPHVDPSYRTISTTLIRNLITRECTPERIVPVVSLMCRAGHPTILATLHDLVRQGTTPHLKAQAAHVLATLITMRASADIVAPCLRAIPTAPDQLHRLIEANPWLLTTLAAAAATSDQDGNNRSALRQAVAAWQKTPIGFLAHCPLPSRRLLLHLSHHLARSARDVLRGHAGQRTGLLWIRRLWKHHQPQVIAALQALLATGESPQDFLGLLDLICGNDASFGRLRAAVHEWQGLDTLFTALATLRRGDASGWAALQQGIHQGEVARHLITTAVYVMAVNPHHPSHVRAAQWHTELHTAALARQALAHLAARPHYAHDIQ